MKVLGTFNNYIVCNASQICIDSTINDELGASRLSKSFTPEYLKKYLQAYINSIQSHEDLP